MVCRRLCLHALADLRYWYGFDQERRPILWVHPTRKDWKNLDVTAEINLHVAMIEFGLSMMPEGVTTFTVIAHTHGLGFEHVNAGFGKALLKVITVGYPDRLGALYAGPTGTALRTIFSLLSPLMAKRLAEKINLVGNPKKLVLP